MLEATNYSLQRRSTRQTPRKNRRKEFGRINQDCDSNVPLCSAWTKSIAVYHGADVEYLKLQAIQLLLRYQVEALRRLYSLPEAFEVCHISISLFSTSLTKHR